MLDRIALPQDKGELVLKRKIFGMKNPSIEIDGNAEIIPRSSKSEREKSDGYNGESRYTIVVRKSTRDGDISSRATKLKTCKGLSGCEFVKCSYEAFGNIPPNLRKACPTLGIDIEKR